MLRIIKDCSPYYITFTHDGFDHVVDFLRDVYDNGNAIDYEPPILSNIRKVIPTYKTEYKFLDETKFEHILELNPDLKKVNLNPGRQLYMHTKPGVVHPIHLDGPTKQPHRYSINYPVRIQDDRCVTTWYADKNLDRYLNSRIYHPTGPLEILQQVVLRQDEAVLINGEIHHDWDNSKSENDRIVITFRDQNSEDVYYDDVKKVLFDL
jgi:hypothetical protein